MYSDHFGLSERPFQLTPDPHYWFESATHRKAMAYLGYGLAQGEGFIVITGEVGAGKTTLASHLLGVVDPARVHVVRIVSPQVAGDDVVRLVAAGLGLSDAGEKSALLARIEGDLAIRARAGQKALVVIDEAQNLPGETLEELRILSNFQQDGHAMVQILLLGQPELRNRLNHDAALEQLRQRVIATHHLAPMDAAEVEPYVRHRLHRAGWAGKPGIEPAAFEALHAHSGGIPRKINALMTRILMLAALEGRETVDPALVEAVVLDLEQDETAGETPPAAPASAHPDPHALDLAARIAFLEAQSEEQGVALRRVLRLLVEWVEADEGRNGGDPAHRAPAA